ncbi:type II CRISPR RNA-guided endonuclease Cas9 [Daejeonella sp.]|uniref:type II CRISPR RNA-guided endonuclease Cas9 n=1 Tax=Daejeonella sp. TaxID=2805397 RepID=UPI00272FCFE2|nr:type II CRISPR RNA-guided endonuclease Cas9 [Daejeonella sp.]MDP2414943.1 HNH endonuclease domain-containing protein [Daejeonella sp.]
MKKILGLDLGTNSIGWALIDIDHEKKLLKIVGLGSRIIPMDGQEFSKFNAGQKITSAAGNRTTLHRARITKERYLLRRDRLHLVLNLLEALPGHYKIEIDFERNGKKCGQFKDETEPKIAYLPTKNSENKRSFYFEDAFEEMVKDIQKVNPEIKNEKGKRVPKDWTIYYLRQKALKEKISLEELAWVLLSYNQKRGTELDEIENENEKSDEIKELLDLKVISSDPKSDKNGTFYEITLNDAENFTYKEYTNEQLTFKDDIKEVLKISKLDDAGNIEKEKVIYQINDLYNLTLSKIEHKETDDKKFKHIYNFIYSNGWENEKKKEKWNKPYNSLEKKLEDESKKENPKIFSDLFVISNKYNFKGQPETLIPSIKIPDFNSEGSKDWTLLKKKTEKDAIKFNIDKGYINEDNSAKYYISPKIYNVLINDAKTGEPTKIIGGLFQTIDRKFYREELQQIIATQKQFYKTFEDQSVFEKCVKLLYPHNAEHAKALLQNKNALAHLLVEDILLYQRPLQPKKSEISDCKYEIDYWKEEVDTTTGEVTKRPVYKKVVSASHPLFQEFRIWDKIHNIRLIQLEAKDAEGKSETNVDITSQYFKPEDYQVLFEHFNKRSTVAINDFLEFCKTQFGLDIGKKGERKILWNYPEEEGFKGNETRKSFEIRFKRCGFQDLDRFMTQEKEIELWHYLYSVNQKERTYEDCKSIKSFFNKFLNGSNASDEIKEKLVKDFNNYPKFPSKYCAYSEKALKKILQFIRMGDNSFKGKFDISNFQSDIEKIQFQKAKIPAYLEITQEKLKSLSDDERRILEKKRQNLYEALWKYSINKRIDEILQKLKIIDFSSDEIDYSKVMSIDKDNLSFPKGLFNTFKTFNKPEDFTNLNLTKASYLVYGRHSELAQAKYWDSPQKIREEINKELKHHSLNNPVAEKVLKETMKVVADIWEIYGASTKNFFSEIHLEVARELQKSNQEKKEITERQKNSRTENERLRNILEEFLSQSPYNAKRGNQDHFERLKIVEEGAKGRSYSEKDFYANNIEKFDKKEIESILKKQKISKPDFEKYKLWIEQGYRSPYTNKPITLTDLFNGNKYNIDHILPRASVTNDSLNNKVVCEAFLNRFKSDKTAREFIAQFGGKSHTIFDENLNKNITFELVDEDAYVSLVKTQFRDAKRFILLSKEVPTGFTDSQMNNSKHIARKAMELLSHVVREEGEVEFRSKNLLPVSGMITDRLKREWKFNEVWTELLTPRFERLNTLHNSEDFGKYEISKSGHRYFDIDTKYILEQNKNFELKRLDHRHHALDALIVALCTENHVQFINNINSGITNKKKEKTEAIKKQRAGIKRQIMYSEPDKENPKEKVWIYMLPGSFRMKSSAGNDKSSVADMDWQNNYSDVASKDYKKVVLEALSHCIISFKNDFKLVSKSSNRYESFYNENGNLRLDKNGKPVKEFISQNNKNQKHWSIRKALHTDNPSSKITLQFDRLKIIENTGKAELIIDNRIRDVVKEISGMHDNKIGEVKKYLSKNPIIIDEKPIEYTDFKILNIKYRKRQPITNLSIRTGTGALSTIDAVKDRINKVADLKLRNELLLHLKNNDDDIDRAFSIEGIDEFNKCRKFSVKRLPIAESASLKFSIGKKKTNNHKWVETGGNYHFKIAKNDGNIDHETIPLRFAIKDEKEKILNRNNDVKDTDDYIILSPNDLVYVPTGDELNNNIVIDFANLTNEQKKRLYNVNDFSSTCYFTPNSIAQAIIAKEVDMHYDEKKSKIIGSFDTKTASLDGKQIKDICIKLKLDSLGNISKA